MRRLTESQKLKYWMEAEFTVLHIMFAIIMLQLIDGWFWIAVLISYSIYSLLYLFTKLAVIAADDPDYLRVPKK